VVDLLKEYEDLFPWSFLEMKGITRSLGAMKIQLKLNAKLVKRRPYRLNPKYKEKVAQGVGSDVGCWNHCSHGGVILD
jgi:hypothetical protein